MNKRLITLFAIALCSVACISSVPYAEGEIEERTIAIEGEIDAIVASWGFDIVVDATLPKGEVRLTTHSDIFDKIEITTEGTALNFGFKALKLRAKMLEARVPAYDYNSIAISGGVDLRWEGCTTQHLSVRASGGADANIGGAKVESLTLAASGGADIVVEGTTTTLNAIASGGADIILNNLEAKSAEVAASGGSDISVCATESLVATASGGSDIVYYGEPAQTEINSSGGASIHHSR